MAPIYVHILEVVPFHEPAQFQICELRNRHSTIGIRQSRGSWPRFTSILEIAPLHEPAPFGVPPLGGQGSSVEGVGNENPALEIFPGPQTSAARPAEAGTPSLPGPWPVSIPWPGGWVGQDFCFPISWRLSPWPHDPGRNPDHRQAGRQSRGCAYPSGWLSPAGI
jgi:hypothetical protein